MYGLTKSAFSLLKANKRPGFPWNHVYSSLIPIKREKLEGVRSIFKYLRKDTIEFTFGIPEKTSNNASTDCDVMN